MAAVGGMGEGLCGKEGKEQAKGQQPQKLKLYIERRAA